MILCGFDRVTPAQQALLEALALRGSALKALSPPERHGHAGRVSFASQAEEIAAAAGWARERLALNPDARIGVVVPGLAEVRARLARAFTDAMDPGARLPGRGPDALPFNVSLGLPLCDWPMVHTALSLLQLARGALELNLFGALVRSPFLGGAEAEGAARARLDAKLREIGEMEVGLAAASRLAGEQGPCHCPVLARSLGALAGIHAGVRGRHPVSVWSRAFMDLLRAAGFPGERTLSSAEYQTLARWRELLGSLSTLDPVTGRVDFDTALSRLRRIAADSVFQPETPELPIQVLGMLEAAGQEFDHLWVMGLSDEAWPPAPRPNPFLPVGLQRRAGLPNASASERLEFARRLTAGWLCAAGEVILSSPRREDDRELGASPLIASIPEREAAALRIPALPDNRRLLHPASTLTELEDWRAPPVQPGIALPHGTAVFADQAACPFRAFAIHRLDARGVAVPEAGLGPRERGMLVHDVLAQVWRRIRSQAALVAMEEPERLEIIAEAARRALARASRDRPRTLSGRFLELERERLTRLVRDWLQRELERLPFEVAAVEDKRSLQVGSLLLNARLDRVDRLPEGRTLIIDYKTGRTSVAKWLGPRPEEPQLPLYAVAAGEEVAAVAFAQVRSGDMKLSGFARDADILPEGRAFTDTKHASGYAGWDGLLAAWRSELERLAAQFAAGEAAVDPKRYPGTCEYCELGPLCRVEERRRAGPEDESDE